MVLCLLRIKTDFLSTQTKYITFSYSDFIINQRQVLNLESIVDITHRDGMSRLGSWTIGKERIKIPTIAGIHTPRLPLFHKHDIELSDLQDLNELNKQKLDSDESKLRLYYKGNPLLQNHNEPVDTSKLKEPYFLIPGTIHYPESFTEYGIPIEEIFKKDSQTNDRSELVQLISDNSAEVNSQTNLCILLNATRLINNPRALVNRISSIKHRNNPNSLLYLPGVATVNNLAILLYLGVDLIDNTQCILQARIGNLMTTTGPLQQELLESLDHSCGCSGCTGDDTKESSFENILKHNLFALNSELSLVSAAILKGNLRSLVEQRMVTEPDLAAIVRILDLENYSAFEPYFPVYQAGEFITCSRESLNRVEVQRFQDRIKERYNKPEQAKVLLILPCSAKKPYSISKSHRLFKRTILSALNIDTIPGWLHEVIITSPLGLVPRELELVYPAQQYDIPVTGHWYEDEKLMIKDCITDYLNKNQYDCIMIHFDGEFGDFIEHCVSETLVKNGGGSASSANIHRSCSGHPTADRSLDKLSLELKDLSNEYKKHPSASFVRNNIEIIRSIARYQFGEPGIEFVNDCKVKGKYPFIKIFKNNSQQGMLTGDRGFISLTLDGAKSLAGSSGFNYKVQIDDFSPKGSIMAVGVESADESIRIGDEVVALHKDVVRGVGTAAMRGVEMEKSRRGVAVKVRHHS
jgi:archaeosine synthase